MLGTTADLCDLHSTTIICLNYRYPNIMSHNKDLLQMHFAVSVYILRSRYNST